jgi:hypothetical protein
MILQLPDALKVQRVATPQIWIGEYRMKERKILFKTLFVVLIAAAASLGVYGQSDGRPVEPSYEVSLQLIVGSNDPAAKPEVPANLSNISKQLRSSFAFTNYRLAGTFLGRITNSGNFEYKSTTNMFGQESEKTRPTFLDWSLLDLRNGPTSSGKRGFQAQVFRLGARVPVTVSKVSDNGVANSIIQYESIGLNLSKVGIAENAPTLIGTLNLPGADGTVFLVMTVRNAEL